VSNTTLNLYRKILNLNNLQDISYIFENKSFLDIVYDKYRFNPDTNKYYIDETNVNLTVSKDLELEWIKMYANDIYDLYNYFFENTSKYVETTKTLSDGDIIKVYGLLDDTKDGLYTVASVVGNVITVDETTLPTYTGTFYVTKDNFIWSATETASTNEITLENYTQNNYMNVIETDEECFNRLVATETYRKMFLSFLPEFQKLKGTKTYMYFIIKFFYLIKYYDLTLSASENLSASELICEINDSDTQCDTNFVFSITCDIPKTVYDVCLKPVICPHGWIDYYYETSGIIPYGYAENNTFNLKNDNCYIDILASKRDRVLNELCNIKRYGNVEMENLVPFGLQTGTMNIAGFYSYLTFGGYDAGLDKVENVISRLMTGEDERTLPTINPPVYIFNGYEPVTNATQIINYVDSSQIFNDGDGGVYADLYNYYAFDIEYLLVDFDVHPYDNVNVKLMTSPLPNTTYDKIYIQSIAEDDSDPENPIVYAKSDIVSFDISYSQTNPTNINKIIPNPVPPSPK